MKLFDSHCHMDDKIFVHDFADVLDRAAAAGVAGMMIAGVDEASSFRAVALAEETAGIYASVGVHPHDAKDCNDALLETLARLARESRSVRAWGETGLDFNRMYSSQKDQEKWFVRQIQMADKLGFPLIFHERDSKGVFLELIKNHHQNPGNGVVHCFSGNRNELLRYVQMGYYIGITGIVTLEERGAALRRLIAEIPENRILIETDAPYLTPVPVKNKTRRNEPAFVRFVLLRLAEILDLDVEYLSGQIFSNTCRLFQIDEGNQPRTPFAGAAL